MGSNVAIRGFDTRPIAAPIARSPAGVAKKLLLQREPLQLCLRSLCPLLHQQDQHAEGQLRAFYSQRIYLFSSRQKRKGRWQALQQASQWVFAWSKSVWFTTKCSRPKT